MPTTVKSATRTFVSDADTFRGELAAADKAVARLGAGTLPVLAGVRIRVNHSRIVLQTTDLETTATVWFPTVAGEDTEFVVNRRILLGVLGCLSGPVKFEHYPNENRLEIRADSYHGRIATEPGSVWPDVPDADSDPVVFGTGQVFPALKRAVTAAAADDSRPVLNSVLLTRPAGTDAFRAVATDSYRIAVADTSEPQFVDNDTIIHRSGIVALLGLHAGYDTVTVTRDDRKMTFTVGSRKEGRTVTVRIVDSPFPQYEKLVDVDTHGTVRIDRARLIEAVERVQATNSGDMPVRFNFTSKHVELAAWDRDMASATELVPAVEDGFAVTAAAFNPDYLLAGLRGFDGIDVEIQPTGGDMAPFKLVSDNTSGLYLLMPVRLP